MSDAGKRARKGGDMDRERVHGTDRREHMKPLAWYIKIFNKTLNIRAGDMAQSVKCLSHKHKDPS